MKRRDFLKSSLLTVGALGLGQYTFANEPINALTAKPVPQFGDPASDYLTAYIYDSETSAVWVR